MNRRSFIRTVSAAGMGCAWGRLLRAESGPPNLGPMAYQLGWVKNFQFAGDYIADSRGYYRKFGLSRVELLAGGPGVVVDPMVVSGKALVGQSSPDFMANAIDHGAPLKCIGAGYQRNVACVISMAKTPLATPHDLIGKRIGIQTMNLVIWNAFLKLNRIDPGRVATVPVQFDFAPLVSGEVDGFFGETTDDVTHLQSHGYDVQVLAFTDFGYRMLTATYSVRADSLADPTRRAQLVAFMKASILGWNEAIKDPALGARLTVEDYGRGMGLDLATEERSCRAVNPFMVSPDTEAHGLFWMSPRSVQETVETLAASDVHATPEMFTNEILEEARRG